jgi:hypothetical protein
MNEANSREESRVEVVLEGLFVAQGVQVMLVGNLEIRVIIIQPLATLR